VSVKELLDRADVIKRKQYQADVEVLRQVAAKMKQHGRSSSTAAEDTRQSLKETTKQSLLEQKRKDAPPYKVSV
jgi:hypothetical protein